MIKGIWRMLQPFRFYAFRYPIKIWSAYFTFLNDWKKFKRLGGQLSFRYIYPSLVFKNNDAQSGGGHYFYQDIWALKKLAALKPAMHYDIGSRFDGFTGQATALFPVTCIDIRAPSFSLPGLHFLQGDILKLPFESNSVKTLSCLHTIEHIGLGRYGDAINPLGFDESLSELQRIIKPGGFLVLSMPVGKQRIEFNSQRILHPFYCIQKLTQMQLIEFSVVDDDNKFIEHTSPELYIDKKYCCGLYLFQKELTGNYSL